MTGRAASPRRSWPVEFAVLLAGSALTLGAAIWMDRPGRDTTELIGLAIGAAVAAGVVGVSVQWAMRAGSLRAQAVAVALVAVFGTTVGVVLASSAMVLSSEDLGALLVVLGASATVAVVLAVRLGARVDRTARTVEDLARRLGAGEVIDASQPQPVSIEMQRLMDELGAASRRLRDARARQRAMEDARRTLIAGVSHDLRTPLAGIRAMVEAIEDGVVDDPDEVARYQRRIGSETERLAVLVDDLFELSRIEAGALELSTMRLRLVDVVTESVDAMAPLAAAKRIELSLDGRADPEVQVAPREFGRVLANLLDNAVRHTPAGGQVEVRIDVDRRRPTVSVRDGCGGIDLPELDRVFDLAFRGDEARTASADQGGGLGLAIARGLVDAHHGSITVDNEAPGCRFTVTLPPADAEPSTPATTS